MGVMDAIPLMRHAGKVNSPKFNASRRTLTAIVMLKSSRRRSDCSAAYDPRSKIFHSDRRRLQFPEDESTDLATFVFSRRECSSGCRLKEVALVDGVSGQELTFGEVEKAMISLANGLHDMGIQRGDVVMILAPNSIYFPIAFLGISYLGAVVATPNPLGTAEDVQHQVKLTNVKLVITTTDLLYKLQGLSLPTIVMDLHDKDVSGNPPSPGDGFVGFFEMLKASSPENLRPFKQESRADDAAAVLYSSGTTGMSKGVLLSHKNVIAQIMQLTSAEYDDASSLKKEVHLCALPMSHIFGSVVVTLQQLYRGNQTVVLRGFELDGMLQAIQRYQISHIYVVPPILVTLTKTLQKNHSFKNNLQCLRSILCGAAPLGKELIGACSCFLPNTSFYQIYGLTEVTGALTMNSKATMNAASVGTLLSDMEARVVDVDTEEPLAPNQHGELLVRGPTTMIGYMNDPKSTNFTLDSDGWLRTGDLVYLDESGNVYVVDRIKELIKYKALQVAPAELEALLLSHPQILDAAVVPYKSHEAGEIPMAFIVPTSEGNLTEGEVKAFVAEHVAPYKRVRRVAFTNVIPKTASGKILRKELVKQV